MTTPSEDPNDDLTATEGVDEGSAASTVEGPGSGAAPAPDRRGAAVDTESAPAPPLDLASATAHEAGQGSGQQGSGQQLAAGEG